MPKLIENALLVYTDGSLHPKGRRGGYGAVFIQVNGIGEKVVVAEHSPPGVRGSTNNRMELQACIDALKIAPKMPCFEEVQTVAIRTDSRYVKDSYPLALGPWRRASWCNTDGRPVDNADLWKEFVRAYGKLRKRILIDWVKGHGKGKAKDAYNYRADALAKDAAKSPLSQPVHRSSVRRKIAPGYTKRGSVRLIGQTLVIYIIEVQRLRVQKTWKYRYQVASADSRDRHAIDWIYSTEQMRDGHYYEVQLNDNMAHPQVLAVIREVPAAEVPK